MNLKNVYHKVLTILAIVAYLSMYLLMASLANKFDDSIVKYILSVPLRPSTVRGFLNSLLLGLAAIMVLASNGKLYFVTLALQSFNLIGVCIDLIVVKNYTSIPGLTTTILSIILTTIMKLYLKRLKLNELELDRAAYVDALTGCLNRRGLLRELDVKAKIGKSFFLVFLDLDNFKQVNDTLGHDAGDKLLLETANLWSNLDPRFPFTLSRLGGDEFAMILETTDKKEMNAFMKTVVKSIGNTDSEFNSYITTSAGVAQFPQDAADVNQLLIYADTAMYKAKIAGKNSYVIFNKKMYQELAERYLTEEDIKNAIQNNTFTMLYQPQYELCSHKLIGYEALLRMNNKDGNGFVDTQTFINVAEKSGLIYDIDFWVLKHTLLQTKGVVDRRPNLEVSVNISGKHLTVAGFVDKVIDILVETNFNPQQLKLEITESSYIKHIDDAVTVINRLKLLGIKIALDDFGTGYSSLNYLSRIPVDLLKIDKSFITEMLFNKQRSNIIDIIIKLGHLMGCKVIAEGVEDEEQVEILTALNCDYLQGYIWGKPEPIEQVKLEN